MPIAHHRSIRGAAAGPTKQKQRFMAANSKKFKIQIATGSFKNF
jgi:hypothetical protein